jgi:transposase
MRKPSTVLPVAATVGFDLGDRRSRLCVLGEGGEIEEAQIETSREAIEEFLSGRSRCRVVMEAGSQSPWVSRLVTGLGHEAIVANPRKLHLITKSERKSDRLDALTLARLGRADVGLLHPVRHRREEVQTDLNVLRARDLLVRSRTRMINHVRSEVKAAGGRLRGISAEGFGKRALEQVPGHLRAALVPILTMIATLTRSIQEFDRRIEALCAKYPATQRMREIAGVGPITSLAFVLTIDEPQRFGSSRMVGAYLGLVPRRDQSGTTERQLPISKSGDRMLRRLLVGCAQYILGPFGPDTSLRRFGLDLARRGAGNGKKRAVVAVARKLAVLLHRLWVSEEGYEPLRAARPLPEPATPA